VAVLTALDLRDLNIHLDLVHAKNRNNPVPSHEHCRTNSVEGTPSHSLGTITPDATFKSAAAPKTPWQKRAGQSSAVRLWSGPYKALRYRRENRKESPPPASSYWLPWPSVTLTSGAPPRLALEVENILTFNRA